MRIDALASAALLEDRSCRRLLDAAAVANAHALDHLAQRGAFGFEGADDLEAVLVKVKEVALSGRLGEGDEYELVFLMGRMTFPVRSALRIEEVRRGAVESVDATFLLARRVADRGRGTPRDLFTPYRWPGGREASDAEWMRLETLHAMTHASVAMYHAGGVGPREPMRMLEGWFRAALLAPLG